MHNEGKRSKRGLIPPDYAFKEEYEKYVKQNTKQLRKLKRELNGDNMTSPPYPDYGQ
jgi:hypothetical protein